MTSAADGERSSGDGTALTEPEPRPPLNEDEDHETTFAETSHNLWRGLISLVILVAIVVGLLLAVPGLSGVAHQVTNMKLGWIVVAVVLEILSCLGYVLAFLQVFDRSPVRFGARVALSELAFNAAVSLGGAGSVAVGAWLLVDRGGDPVRVAERSAVLFLLTSAINVITLLLAGVAVWLGLLSGSENVLLTLVPAAVGALTLVVFLLLPRFGERLAAARSPGRLRTLLREAAVAIRLTQAVLFSADWRTIGAVAYLWCDIAVLGACFAAAGHVPPVGVIVLAYQIGYLSNLIPVPGNIGVLDGSLLGMFVLYGVSATLATAATVVYHAISLWIPAMWGTVTFIMLRRSRGRPITLRPPGRRRQEQEDAARMGSKR